MPCHRFTILCREHNISCPDRPTPFHLIQNSHGIIVQAYRTSLPAFAYYGNGLLLEITVSPSQATHLSGSKPCICQKHYPKTGYIRTVFQNCPIVSLIQEINVRGIFRQFLDPICWIINTVVLMDTFTQGLDCTHAVIDGLVNKAPYSSGS